MPSSCDRRRRVLIVTGEASGDLLGANLVTAARALDAAVEFYAVGGDKMAAAGCEIVVPSSELAVMGLVEVVRSLPRIWRVYRRLTGLLRGADRPDLVILIDSPDFNLRLAKVARNCAVPVLYYVSPQVWAWRRGRVRTIAARVDKLAALFPFEPQYYAGLPIDVRYVGHPLLDEVARCRPAHKCRRQLQLEDSYPRIALFPGSRSNEIKYCFDTIVASAARLSARYPAAVFVVAVAAHVDEELLRQKLAAAGVRARLVREDIYTVAAACDAAICVSGTITLQVALVQTPMVIIYKAAALTYAIGKRLVQVRHFGLPNIVAGRCVVRELLQDEASAEAVSAEVGRILDDDAYRAELVAGLAEVKKQMGSPGCSRRVAQMALELMAADTEENN